MVNAILMQLDSPFISFLFLIILLILYPKLYIWQTIFSIEMKVRELELYSNKARNLVLRRISKVPGQNLREAVRKFMDFFAIEPVSLDPYGLIRKIEFVMDESERRFDDFVQQIAPEMSAMEKANIKYSLMGSMGVYQIFKVIRHFLITIKKTGNLQLALILQMMMPQLMKIAKAEVKCVDAFVHGIPIGDAIGPLVAASFKTKAGKEIAKDVLASTEKIAGKNVIVMKAKGPGGALGKWGDAVEILAKRRQVDHIITIDAAGKLEGERTGDVAEGVGVLLGESTRRYKIEEVATKYKIPIDGIAIKMSGEEEAPIALKKEIFAAVEPTKEIVSRLVRDSKKKKILVIGVGNTCGIGNTEKEIKGLDAKLRPVWAQQAREEEEEKKKLKKFFGRV